MNRLSIAVVLISASFINGCGGDESDFSGGTTTNNSSSVSSFDGTWSNGCQYDQISGIAESLSLTISGNNSNIDLKTYENSDCSGEALDSINSQLNLLYPGQLALNNCFNAQKVDASFQFPVTFNGAEFTENQFNALPSSTINELSLIQSFDLMCVNSSASILFLGDITSGQGTSDSNRPTRASLSSGFARIR